MAAHFTTTARRLMSHHISAKLYRELPTELFHIQNIPFQFVGSHSQGPSLLALGDPPASNDAGDTVRGIRIPLPHRRLTHLALFLAALHAQRPGPLARIRLHPTDQRKKTRERTIATLGVHPTDKQRRQANIQDWWPGVPILSQGRGSRPVMLGIPEHNLEQHRVFYISSWKLTGPGQAYTDVEIETLGPDPAMRLLIFAISLRNAG
jgi:hypothetical protein